MGGKPATNKRAMSADWLVQGVLTKIGDAFDRLTGRGWKPSSSLATSELAERMKALVDSEIRETPDKRRFVPHNIQLKMQWDKFSADSEESLKKLETELLTALIDHINDNRYYTYSHISLNVKPDYFTNGVKLFASYDEKNEDEREASINVTVPSLKIDAANQPEVLKFLPGGLTLRIDIQVGARSFHKELSFEPGTRVSVGRTADNQLEIDDQSVSKMHASLLLNNDGKLVLADTGSTNGTFVNGVRIAYGKAVEFGQGDKLKFGSAEASVTALERRDQEIVVDGEAHNEAETYRLGEFEFSRHGGRPEAAAEPAVTVPSIPMPSATILRPLAGDTEGPVVSSAAERPSASED